MIPKSLISNLLQYSLTASRNSVAPVKLPTNHHTLLRLISVGSAKEPGTEPVSAVNSPNKSSTWEVEFGSVVEERAHKTHHQQESEGVEETSSKQQRQAKVRPEAASVKERWGGDGERMENQRERSEEKTATGADPARFPGLGGS